MYENPMEYKGVIYPSAANAYQGTKTGGADLHASITPRGSITVGREETRQSKWPEIKEKVMYEINLAKYKNDAALKQRLLDTGDVYLEPELEAGEKYWGVTNGQGENRLGKILMKIREELKNE
jgi:predicted NAD-dependent protein-ADP-ribosyltransferase YbiA (DUF1768 family)